MNNKDVSINYLGDNGILYAKGIQDRGNHLGYKLQSRFFLPYLNQEWNVLDLGCANGGISIQIQPYVKTIEGIEVNTYTREIAISQLKSIVYDGIDSIPMDKKFDAIITNHVLEHIPNVCQTLEKLKEHLVSNGLIIAIVPIESLKNRAQRKWNQNDKDHHLYSWTPLLLGNLFKEAGFVPKKFRIITSTWSPKLFFLGDNVFQLWANYFLALIKRNKQLLIIAQKSCE